MYPTRDSLVWLFTLTASLVGYLLADGRPPTEWAYNDWLKAVAAIAAIISAKLQGSPLQLSYKGQEQVARGQNPFYELPPREPDAGEKRLDMEYLAGDEKLPDKK